MLFFVKLNPEISSWVLEAAKAALIVPLFFLAAKKMTNIAVVLCRVVSCPVVSYRISTTLTAARTVNAVAVCKKGWAGADAIQD